MAAVASGTTAPRRPDACY